MVPFGFELPPILYPAIQWWTRRGRLISWRNGRRDLTTFPTPLQRRLLKAADEIEAAPPETILYQHAVLCQTALPYRNPGNDVRVWERLNGTTHLEIIAGKAMHPERGRLVEVGVGALGGWRSR